MSAEENNITSFVETVLTDEVKMEMIHLAYAICPDIEKVDQGDAGGMMGALVAYGMYLGIAMAREEVKPSDVELEAFLTMYPGIREAVETSKA